MSDALQRQHFLGNESHPTKQVDVSRSRIVESPLPALKNHAHMSGFYEDVEC